MITLGPKLGLLVNGDQGEEHYSDLMRFFRGLDALIQPNVISATTVEPPSGGSADGDCYIVPATGALFPWNFGLDNAIVRYNGLFDEWEGYLPKNGWIAWDNETNQHLRYHDTDGWQPLGTAVTP